MSIEIDDETGRETIRLQENGHEISDPSVLRKVKQDPAFKARIGDTRKKVFNEIKEKTDVLISIHQHCISRPDWTAISDQLSSAVPMRYQRVPFSLPEPLEDDVRAELAAEARRTIRALFGKRKKVQAYVDERVAASYNQELNRWCESKKRHELEQDENETKKNAEYLEQFNNWKTAIHSVLNAGSTEMSELLEKSLAEIELPVEFSIGFEVRDSGGTVFLDIDLPEIEDYPTTKAQLLKSGKVSVKPKTQKELKLDYLNSVTGIAFYFASIAFATSPTVSLVVVSGFTQRVNLATGNVEDTYVYSVEFPVSNFFELNIDRIEPHLALQGFRHAIELTKTYEMKRVQPFS